MISSISVFTRRLGSQRNPPTTGLPELGESKQDTSVKTNPVAKEGTGGVWARTW